MRYRIQCQGMPTQHRASKREAIKLARNILTQGWGSLHSEVIGVDDTNSGYNLGCEIHFDMINGKIQTTIHGE